MNFLLGKVFPCFLGKNDLHCRSLVSDTSFVSDGVERGCEALPWRPYDTRAHSGTLTDIGQCSCNGWRRSRREGGHSEEEEQQERDGIRRERSTAANGKDS